MHRQERERGRSQRSDFPPSRPERVEVLQFRRDETRAYDSARAKCRASRSGSHIADEAIESSKINPGDREAAVARLISSMSSFSEGFSYKLAKHIQTIGGVHNAHKTMCPLIH